MAITLPNPLSQKGKKGTPWKAIAIAVFAILVLAAGIYAATQNNNPASKKSDGANTANRAAENTNLTNAVALSSCSLPETQVPELAMRYGAPAGWIVEKQNGTLAIMEDENNLTTAFVYTAKLEKDLSAQEFLNQFGAIFKATVEDAGGSFALGTQTASGDTATAPVEATVAEGDLRGVFETKKESGFVTFTAYWAPSDEFATKETTLKEIIGCYARTTSLSDEQLALTTKAKNENGGESSNQLPWGALTNRSDGSFTFQAPADWTSNVSAASESTGLALDAPDSDASVAFLYNLGRYGVTDTAEFARTTMSITYGIEATLANKQSVDGADLYEFSGTFNGKNVRGAAAVRVEAFQTFFAHYLGIQIANENLWTTYAPTLNAIQASIRLTDAGQQLSSLPALPNYSTEALFGSGTNSSVTSGQKYKQEVEDRASDNWADAMLEYETVESPTTGDRYDVPLNSWNTTGPNGAGYYRQLPGGGMEMLTPVQ